MQSYQVHRRMPFSAKQHSFHTVNMELPQYPQAVHAVEPYNCDAHDVAISESVPQPTESPPGNNDAELLPCPPKAHLVESCDPQKHHDNDIESNLPRKKLTSGWIERLLSMISSSKAIRTRTRPPFELPRSFPNPPTLQTRIRRLRKLPHLVRAMQAHVKQVSEIPRVIQAMQAGIEQTSNIRPLVQELGQFLRAPASDPNVSRPTSPVDRCCFICIAMSGREIVAMKIPCPRRKLAISKHRGTVPMEIPCPPPASKHRETKTYKMIKERLKVYYGMSRFLPFYGIQDVQEVNV